MVLILFAFALAHGFVALLLLSIALGLAFAPIVPLTDGLTLRAAVDYGRVRLFGSLAFIVASVGGGFALEGRAPGVVLVTVQAIAIVILAASLALPRVVAVTYSENQASQQVLDKLGFERRGIRDYKGVQATYHVLTAVAWAALSRRDGSAH